MQKIQIIEERHKADLEYQAKMVRRARYDSLTNLYSKDYFIEKTNELLKNNPNKVYTLIRINVENFKLINKVYGQEIGDVVLLKIAEKMRNTINQSGVYGRIYADHFAICYPLTPLEIKQLTALKANYIEIDGQYIRVQVNMGIYINQAHLLDACQLLDYALMAMQNQDASSSKHISFFKESYLATLIKNQEITNEMDSALESGQFHVYLQPQFEIFSNKLVGAEALVRWMHPQKGIISPNQFIPVFENNRFIYKLDNYVFECVCKQLASWQRMGKIIPISVNLSRINLLNPDLLLMIEQNLLKYQIPVEYIHLEITESIYAEDQQELIGIVKQLQERGFVIEMDDFGSGYSSLNMLKDVPVDILKMDIEFFSGETHMERGANIIEAIVNLAHSLDILVIVEGVETIREINFLKSINCHFAQGYFFGKAMSASDFTVVLQENVIAPKTIELVHNNRYENLYWKIEKLNNLMLSEQAILLDYDPNDDYVVFSHIGKDGEIHERGISDYGLNMLKNETIHPNYRLYLKDILLGKKKQKEEVDYLADYLKIGRFEQYHATVYCHFRDNKLNRVIGIIKKCND